ncbi:MAG: hypothetical protein ASARMPREDX12_006151 [Alectoria sarmentosa]|nr:MAG: hypothetical protein ASARMPREDX12_006151 [Alectoria sarmentosa]
MAAAPTSIKLLVLPEDGSPARPEELQTVKEDIRTSNRPTDLSDSTSKSLDSELAVMAGVHTFYNWDNGTLQPNVSLLPDAREKHWHTEAWKQRAVLGTAKHHLFYTRSKSGFVPNPHVGGKVSDDVFVLKLSDTRDEDGRRFYVDLERETMEQEEEVGELCSTIAQAPRALSFTLVQSRMQ